MMALAYDLRIALRALRRRPGAFCVGVVVIGVALGGGATLLGVVDAALLRPPEHVRAPGEVVRVDVAARGVGRGPAWLSFPLYELVRDGVESLDGVAAYGARSIVIGRDEAARQVQAELVTASYFPVLGVEPAAGRFFLREEDTARRISSMVVSYGLAQTFGGVGDALGRSVQVGNERLTVVGVAPRGFTGIDRGRVDVWLPVAWAEELVGRAALSSPSLYWVKIFGRTAAARSVVGAEVAAVSAAADWGPTRGDLGLTLGSMRSARGPGGARSPEGRLLIWVTLAALMVFFIACANVAAVVLVRFVAAAPDLATRAALGGTRARLSRDILSEVAIVAGLGGLVGLGVAQVSSGMAQAWLVPGLDLAEGGVGVRTAGQVAALTLIAGCITGLPAVVSVWTGYGRRQLDGRARAGFARGGGTLVAIQCAAGVGVLIGAGLLGRSLGNALDVDLGVDANGVLYASAQLRGDLSRADALALHKSFAERIAEMPGVEGVTVAMGRPMRDAWGVAVDPPAGRGGAAAEPVVALGRAVDGDYFEVTRVPIVRGRPFEPWEHDSGARVVIINDAFAGEFWPTADPLGGCLRLGNEPECRRVVGVSGDARLAVRWGEEYEVYVPIEEGGLGRRESLGLAIRASANAGGLVVPVRTAIETSDVVTQATVMPVAEILAPQLRPWRVGTSVFAGFGFLALILVGLGLHGLLAFIVARSRRVIGVRVALGATPAMVRRSIVLRGAGVGAIGTAVGLLVGVIVAPVGSSFLFGVEARDPVVFLGSAGVVLVTAMTAGWLPARQASRVDAAALLRED